MKMNLKNISIVLLPIVLAIAITVYYFWFRPWSIEGVWISGPNDGFGLMPVKKEFIAEFGPKQFKFQNIVRPIKSYQYEIEKQLVIMQTEMNLIKIRIVDENTIRFNEGSQGVGLRIYHRKD